MLASNRCRVSKSLQWTPGQSEHMEQTHKTTLKSIPRTTKCANLTTLSVLVQVTKEKNISIRHIRYHNMYRRRGLEAMF